MQSRTYNDFVNEAKQYESICKRYKDTGEVFVDKAFHPVLNIQEDPQEIRPFNPQLHKWIRIDEFFKSPLFADDLIEPNAVKQGEIGDCYLLAALSRIARQPNLVPLLFDTETPNRILGEELESINIKCGAVVVKFHAFGRETPVLIDTLIPFRRGTRIPRFSRPRDIQYSAWFLLVEKAFAKLNGSYSAICGGQFSSTFYTIFGYYPSTKRVTPIVVNGKTTKVVDFDRLQKFLNRGATLGCSIQRQLLQTPVTEEELLDMGLCEYHSYLIQNVINIDGHKLICLRNPWGEHEWLGAWSDTSELWTEELKEKANLEESDDGTFFMGISDFFNYFTTIDVANPIPSNWHSRQFDIQFTPGEYDGLSAQQIQSKNAEDLLAYCLKFTETIPEEENVKIQIVVERRRPNNIKCPNGRGPLFGLTIIDDGKRRTIRSAWQTQNDLFSRGYPIEEKGSTLSFIFHRIQATQYPEDLSIQIMCKYDFDLFAVKTPNNLIKETKDFKLVFNNEMINEKKRRMKNRNNPLRLQLKNLLPNVQPAEEIQPKEKLTLPKTDFLAAPKLLLGAFDQPQQNSQQNAENLKKITEERDTAIRIAQELVAQRDNALKQVQEVITQRNDALLKLKSAIDENGQLNEKYKCAKRKLHKYKDVIEAAAKKEDE